MAAISEIRPGMRVFSAEETAIGTVQAIEDDRIILLGAPDTIYEGGHYQAAIVLVGSVQEGQVFLSNDAEAALILEEGHLAVSPETENLAENNPVGDDGTNLSTRQRSGNSTAILFGLLLVGAVAVSAIPFIFGSRKRAETRPQEAGEAATTRFGMEDGDNTDIPVTEPYLR